MVSSTQAERASLQSILGDSIVIWRAWIVWGRRLSVVIFPLVLLVGVACMDRNLLSLRVPHSLLRSFIFWHGLCTSPSAPGPGLCNSVPEVHDRAALSYARDKSRGYLPYTLARVVRFPHS
jgi:hypothetical protein